MASVTSRRQLLSTGVALALSLSAASLAAPAWAKSSAEKVVAIDKGERGVTVTLALESAPFPEDADQYRDPTVIVFVPDYFRLPKKRRVDVVVHFHGHHTSASQSMTSHQLREQLDDSKQNAILVMPQGPKHAADSSGGQLDEKGGLSRMLKEIVQVIRSSKVSKALGKSSLAGCKDVGMVVLSAHSGGYAVAASCARKGGVNVHEIYLFDALYGRVKDYAAWVAARRDKSGRERHKLISHYASGVVKDNNLDLMKRLRGAGVKVLHEKVAGQLTREELTKGTAIFIGTSGQSHGQVTHSMNNLRDCLYASGLKRYVKSDWFENKKKPREIERR